MYPVDLRVEVPARSSRFWAIPILGLMVKGIILIPHLIVLYVLGIVAVLLLFVAWIPVLFTGRYPLWAYQYFSGVLRWNVRLSAYYLGLTDAYPPFSFGDPTGVGSNAMAFAPGGMPLPGQPQRVYTCSRCGKATAEPSNFCPNCGLQMAAAPAGLASGVTGGAPSLSADLPNICAVCQRRLTDDERVYCAAHPERFFGRVYCSQHQLAPSSPAGT